VKYVILIHSNPTTQQVWANWTDEQRNQLGLTHKAIDAELTATGQLVTSAGLVPGDQATWVSIRDNEIMATDGPYAEAKEYVAGFYVVECTDLDHAIRIAAKLPEAGYSQVEVRPVFDMTTLDT
jgi:hypothetical protein